MLRFIFESVIQYLGLFELLGLLIAAVIVFQSLHRIGPTEVGLVLKRFSPRKLTKDDPIPFNGTARLASRPIS